VLALGGVTASTVAAVADGGAPSGYVSSGPYQPAVRLTPAPRTMTVAATGDILPENEVLQAGARAAAGTGARYDFAPLFAPITPLIHWSDLAICHMETPIGAPGQTPGWHGPSPVGNRLLAPYEMADSLRRTGFDRCSTASNHSYDLGTEGIASTLAAFDDAGIGHSGTARTAEEAVPKVFTVRDVKVAHLAYTWGSNTEPPADPWSLNDTSDPAVVASAVDAARAAGAEIVILSLHAPYEMGRWPSTTERDFVGTVLERSRVDLVIRQGPHVIQPVRRVNGTLVYWSVGNLVSGMGMPDDGRFSDERTLDGLLATVRFTESSTPGVFNADPWTAVLCNDPDTRTVYPATITLEHAWTPPELREQLVACIMRTREVEPNAS
jgi:poly-gamma-glutamate capsule biosynthesis protein CapA/YwtB (metallophosphatase superfamily)